ncbi:MAG: molybdopterin molybdenumtransferase MoeA, partial [Hyphomicrobiales bacterium]
MTKDTQKTPVLSNDCFSHATDMLTHDEALALMDKNLRAMTPVVPVPLERAGGQYLARDCTAPGPVPNHDNSAMDGYAVAVADLDSAGPTRLRAGGRIAAGNTAPATHKAHTATRIFTGAPVPDGADAVVMQEDTQSLDDGAIVVPAGVKPGANIRRAGEDLQVGDTIANAGSRMRPQDLAALASVGISEI